MRGSSQNGLYVAPQPTWGAFFFKNHVTTWTQQQQRRAADPVQITASRLRLTVFFFTSSSYHTKFSVDQGAPARYYTGGGAVIYHRKFDPSPF